MVGNTQSRPQPSHSSISHRAAKRKRLDMAGTHGWVTVIDGWVWVGVGGGW